MEESTPRLLIILLYVKTINFREVVKKKANVSYHLEVNKNNDWKMTIIFTNHLSGTFYSIFYFIIIIHSVLDLRIILHVLWRTVIACHRMILTLVNRDKTCFMFQYFEKVLFVPLGWYTCVNLIIC